MAIDFDFDIVIVGAGAAGLMAATSLIRPGLKVLVLEASERIGGRIQSFSADGMVFEAGAEFIHGDLPITLGLLKEFRIESIPVSGKMYRSSKGKWNKQTDFAEGWGLLMRKMGELKKDIVLEEFLEEHFPDSKYEQLRQSVKGFAEGFDLADISKCSTIALFEEWKNEDEKQYRIPQGYGALTDALAKTAIEKGCRIETNAPVKEIGWQKERVQIRITTGTEFIAKRALITVPVPLIQNPTLDDAISFDPQIIEQSRLFQKIAYGKLIKVLLLFKEAFWEKTHKSLGFLFSDQPIPTWWTQNPGKSSLLTGWWGNPRLPDDISEKEILALALASLSEIFDLPQDWLSKELKSIFIFNWQNEKYAQGAYSYAMPGTLEAIRLLKKPLLNTLFFAGEAIYTGPAPATVEAAFASAQEAARGILESMD